MSIALLTSFGGKTGDQLMAWFMLGLVAAAAGITFFLLGRHTHRRRKSRRHAKKHAA